MFNNLIESQSHAREFKRRGRFLLATTAIYGLLFFVAGIASIYAYDARLEAQNDNLEVLNWIPPLKAIEAVRPREVQQPRRSTPSTAPIDPNARRPERTDFVSNINDTRKIPDTIGVTASPVPPYREGAVKSDRNADPPVLAQNNSTDCVACNTPVVKIEDKPPAPIPVKPKPERLPSTVLVSKAISLPQPAYPQMAKIARIQGPVNVQILVDEHGKVVSAQAVSGNPMLTTAARDAAMRARFTPTVLNGQAVKVQGVITYNFVLQ